MEKVFLLLGGNQGDTLALFRSALRELELRAGRVVRRSASFTSPSWGFSHPSPFFNQAVELHTELEPEVLLDELLRIEALHGRIREEKASGYSARSLDIDILAYGSRVQDSERLILPHPRMHLRRFALLPFLQLEPGWKHPLLGQTVEALLAACPDRAEVHEVSEEDAV